MIHASSPREKTATAARCQGFTNTLSWNHLQKSRCPLSSPKAPTSPRHPSPAGTRGGVGQERREGLLFAGFPSIHGAKPRAPRSVRTPSCPSRAAEPYHQDCSLQTQFVFFCVKQTIDLGAKAGFLVSTARPASSPFTLVSLFREKLPVRRGVHPSRAARAGSGRCLRWQSHSCYFKALMPQVSFSAGK